MRQFENECEALVLSGILNHRPSENRASVKIELPLHNGDSLSSLRPPMVAQF